MEIDLYPSASNSRKFLAVPAQTDLRTWVPEGEFDDDLKQVYPMQTSGDFQRGQPRIGVNVDRVLDDIERQGWSMVEVNVTISIKSR